MTSKLTYSAGTNRTSLRFSSSGSHVSLPDTPGKFLDLGHSPNLVIEHLVIDLFISIVIAFAMLLPLMAIR